MKSKLKAFEILAALVESALLVSRLKEANKHIFSNTTTRMRILAPSSSRKVTLILLHIAIDVSLSCYAGSLQ